MNALGVDESKIAAVRRYLERKFPQRAIHNRHHSDSITEVFVVENTATYDAHRVKVSRQFLDDNSPGGIEQSLERWKVAEAMTASGRSLVDEPGIALFEAVEDRRFVLVGV